MKRITIALVIMLVLVAGAIGLYFLSEHHKEKDAKEIQAQEDKLVIFSFDEDESTNVSINNEDGEFNMEYSQADGWVMTNDVNFEVNSYTAINICSAMSSLTAEKIIEDSDTSKFGFDNSIDITVTSNNVDYTLHVGNATPTNENFYVMKEGSDDIYLIDYTTGLTLCATKDSLKTVYIANFNPTDITHFALWEGEENDENIRFSMNKNSDGRWEMEKPYPDAIVHTVDINTFINDAIRDKIYNFVAEECPETDYEKYGFDDPQYVYEVSGPEKYVKVIFGDMLNNDTEMYGLFTETGQVVTFSAYTVAALGYDTADVINNEVYNVPYTDVASVKIITDTVEAEVELDGENSVYKLNGKNVNISDQETNTFFFNFYNSFNSASFESLDKEAVPEGEAEVKVEYSLNDGTKVTIEYIPVPGEDSNTYWAMKNGEYTDMVVRKKVIANITTCYEVLNEHLG